MVTNVTTVRVYDGSAMLRPRFLPEIDPELAAQETVKVERTLTASSDQSDQPELPKAKGGMKSEPCSWKDDTISSNEEVTTNVTTPAISSTSMNSMLLDVDFPPEPTGACSVDLTKKIEEMTRLMKRSNCDMNKIIQSKKSFRNPATYEKLVNQCQINEFGTNLDPRVYDPLKWDKTSYYDELAKVQNMNMRRREKEKRLKMNYELLNGPVKKISNAPAVGKRDKKKRKSTCDKAVNTEPCPPNNGPTVADT